MSNYASGEVPEAAIDEQAAGLIASSSVDETQANMMAEAVLQVDENDLVVGPISKADSHYGAGSLHRAFIAYFYNNEHMTKSPSQVFGQIHAAHIP
jgi:hypothetical protein